MQHKNYSPIEINIRPQYAGEKLLIEIRTWSWYYSSWRSHPLSSSNLDLQFHANDSVLNSHDGLFCMVKKQQVFPVNEIESTQRHEHD
jgi:hypothetical protein